MQCIYAKYVKTWCDVKPNKQNVKYAKANDI